MGRTVQNQGYKIRKMYKKTLPVDTALGGLATPVFIFILSGNVPYFYVSLVGPISTLVAELVMAAEESLNFNTILLKTEET